MALTKAQIKNKIDNLTYQKNNYVNERNKYKTSLNYANKLLTDLNSSKKYLDTSEENLKKYFNINGKTPDGGKIKKSQNEINKMIKNVKSTVIPKINNEIERLNRNINNLEYQINNLWRDYRNAES